ncbi:hypothetical protein BN1088_200004 [Sphingobacterium sp. PM2-P1-29]|nr:hypothetical protein BN1088_200004 [Sphingobacterium sp. PM2-P1-29]
MITPILGKRLFFYQDRCTYLDKKTYGLIWANA